MPVGPAESRVGEVGGRHALCFDGRVVQEVDAPSCAASSQGVVLPVDTSHVLSILKLDWLRKATSSGRHSIWPRFWEEVYDALTNVLPTHDVPFNMTVRIETMFFEVQEWR